MGLLIYWTLLLSGAAVLCGFFGYLFGSLGHFLGYLAFGVGSDEIIFIRGIFSVIGYLVGLAVLARFRRFYVVSPLDEELAAEAAKAKLEIEQQELEKNKKTKE